MFPSWQRQQGWRRTGETPGSVPSEGVRVTGDLENEGVISVLGDSILADLTSGGCY